METVSCGQVKRHYPKPNDVRKTILLVFLTLAAGSSSLAQNTEKLVVMVTRANWCPICRANDRKIKEELIPAYATSKEISIIFNDVTNGHTKKISKPKLASHGVYEIAQNEQTTGMITLINPATGQVLQRVHVMYPIEDLEKAIDDALLKVKKTGA